MKLFTGFVFALIGSVFFFTQDAGASEKPAADGNAYLTADFIQLPPLWIPTYNKRQEFRKMQVFTGRLLVDEKSFKNICLNIPKITDTVIVYLNRNPMPKNKLEQHNLAVLSQTLLDKIKKDLNIKGIKSFELHRGDLKQDEQNKLISSVCNRMKLAKK
ncbi:MAG: hypothetical protein IKD08_03735 [Alphaproteobacteria bacterium]|nr:hypothetical protein [Elusimicrobiaceae bacterium]MBR7158775.1 hypothetical protein [Alphaproteobacteria bacterium]